MAKGEMNAFDCAALVRELQPLVGARVDKVFQPAPDEVLVRLRTRATEGEGSKRDLVVLVGKAVTLTRIPRENPTTPPSFSMQLRRALAGGRVEDVRQHEFDRVVEIEVVRGEDRFVLVVELFHDGNVVLVAAPAPGTASGGRIVAALLQQSWATREVRPGAEFRHPPARTRPRDLGYDEFRTRLLASESDAVRTLATEFNLGGQYAEEVTARAGVAKNTPTRDLLEKDVQALHGALVDMVAALDEGRFDPVVVWKGDARVDAAPWPLAEHARPLLRVERAPTFADALDQYYSKPVTVDRVDPQLKRWQEERAKVVRQLEFQKAALDRFAAEEAEARQRGDLLYAHFQEAQAAIQYVAALGKSLGWKDGLERLKAAKEEGRPDALLVDQVLPKEAAASLALLGPDGKTRKVRVDFRKDVQGNAQAFYDKAKKFREKQAGARVALAHSEARLKDLDTKGASILAKVEARKTAAKPTKRFWFEAYRWFRTSDGFLVLGGRDAASNEKLVKKQLDEEDRYVHADLHGAPSVVVKADGREVTDVALDEAAAYAVLMSRAWAAGHAAGEAYWVTPSQVSKTPNPGEYVAKGAFIIRGKRNYRSVRVRFAVGEVDVEGTRKVMGGPEPALAKAEKRVVLEPGDEPANALAPRLAKAFDVPVEEIQAVLPPGGSKVVEAHGVTV